MNSVAQIYREHEVKKDMIAMTILLVSFSMLFATLLLGYTVYRFSNQVWPPIGFASVDLLYPVASTIIITLSSLTYHLAYVSFARKNMAAYKRNILFTIVLALVFFAAQWVLWSSMNASGIYVETGIFASILHGFTWIHAAHVVLGLFTLLYALKLSGLVKVEDRHYSTVSNIGKFWHFLTVIWFVMFLTLFIL